MANSNASVKSINLPAFKLITKADLAPVGRGLVATKCTVTVHDNGQISFSTLASKTLSTDKVFFAFDERTRELYCIGATPANIKQHKASDDSIFTCKTAKKGGTYSVASSGLLQSQDIFCEVDKQGNITKDGRYDYKGSGNQIFEAVDHPGSNMVVFQLPVGCLKKREIQKRTRKLKAEGPGTTVNGPNGAMVNAVNTTASAPEEVLQLGE